MAAALDQDLDGGGIGHPQTIGPVGRQGVEAIDDREDPRADRNRRADQAARIAAPVPALVVGAHDRHDRIRELDEREDVGADVDVQLHLVELGGRQLSRLVEDVLRHRELPGIVQQGGASIAFNVGSSSTPSARASADRVRLHSTHVAVRHVVFRVDGHRERLNRGQSTSDRRARRAGERPRPARTSHAASDESTATTGRITATAVRLIC